MLDVSFETEKDIWYIIFDNYRQRKVKINFHGTCQVKLLAPRSALALTMIARETANTPKFCQRRCHASVVTLRAIWGHHLAILLGVPVYSFQPALLWAFYQDPPEGQHMDEHRVRQHMNWLHGMRCEWSRLVNRLNLLELHFSSGVAFSCHLACRSHWRSSKEPL